MSKNIKLRVTTADINKARDLVNSSPDGNWDGWNPIEEALIRKRPGKTVYVGHGAATVLGKRKAKEYLLSPGGAHFLFLFLEGHEVHPITTTLKRIR